MPAFQETKKRNDFESENYDTMHLRQKNQEEAKNFGHEHENEEEYEDQYQHHQNQNQHQYQHHQNQYENEEEQHGNIYIQEENQNLETPTYEHEKKQFHGNQFHEEQFNDREFKDNHQKKFMENNEDPHFSENNNYEENQIHEVEYPREFNEEDNVENNYEDDFEHSSIHKREEEKENIIQSHHSGAGEKKNLVGLMTTSSEFTSDRNNFGVKSFLLMFLNSKETFEFFWGVWELKISKILIF